jgi:gamma-glutamyltranspeptidase / glutathione hydrolase
MNLVVCPEIHAAKAGHDVFADSGNAIDAALCAAFVQGVTNHLLCGIGGTISIYVYQADAHKDVYINGEEAMGSGAVPVGWAAELLPGRAEASGRYRLRSRANDVGYQAVMVPGFVRGCWRAYERFGSGRLSWARILEPAIRLAADGFDVPPYSASFWRDFFHQEERSRVEDGTVPRWEISPGSRELMLRENGTPYGQGDRFVQSDLARTLKRLATAGADDFYSGQIGTELAAELTRHGALVTAADLRDYMVDLDEPLRGSYRGMDLAAQPYSNGSKIIEILQILDSFDLGALGHNTPAYIDLVAKAMRGANADFLRVEGSTRDDIRPIEQEIASRERAADWASRIKSGDPVDLGAGVTARGTTHLTAADSGGNVISLNHSIGYGGSGVVVDGLGFLLNGDVGHYNPVPGSHDSVVGGKKFLGGSSLAVLRDGVPYIVLGAPGGTRIVTSVVQSVLNVVDFGMDMQTAVTAPRFHSQDRLRIFLEPSIDERTADRLSAMGRDVRQSHYQARPQAIRILPTRLEGGSDPRGQLSRDIGEFPDYDPTLDPAHA